MLNNKPHIIERENQRMARRSAWRVSSNRNRPSLGFKWPGWMSFVVVMRGSPTYRGIVLPLWVPCVVILIPSGILWWKRHEHLNAGHCRICEYNLKGNVSGQCPECGTMIEPEETTV